MLKIGENHGKIHFFCIFSLNFGRVGVRARGKNFARAPIWCWSKILSIFFVATTKCNNSSKFHLPENLLFFVVATKKCCQKIFQQHRKNFGLTIFLKNCFWFPYMQKNAFVLGGGKIGQDLRICIIYDFLFWAGPKRHFLSLRSCRMLNTSTPYLIFYMMVL